MSIRSKIVFSSSKSHQKCYFNFRLLIFLKGATSLRQDTADFKNKRTAVSNSLEYGTINGVFFEQCAKCHDERTIADHRIEEKCANRKWQLHTAVVVFRCRKVGCAGIRKLFKPSPSILCPTQNLFSYLPIIQQRRIEHHEHRTDIMNQCAGNGIAPQSVGNAQKYATC